MKPVDFTLHQPHTLDDAISLLAKHGDDAKVLAGGQSLIPLLNFRLARPEHLIDISRIASLATIKRTTDELVIGAMVRHAQAQTSPAVAEHAPLMAAAFPYIAHQAIRARGTVGGSLAHGDPAAELPAVAVALDATFVAVGPAGRRTIAAKDFFVTNLVTALNADEILTEVRFQPPPPHTGTAFDEVSRRRGDFALVGAGAQLTLAGREITEARICLTGVSAIPHRAAQAEALLLGHDLDDKLLTQVAEATREQIDPTGDLHATAQYRNDIAGVLVSRVVLSAHRQAQPTSTHVA